MDKQPKGIQGLGLRRQKYDRDDFSLVNVKSQRDLFQAENEKNKELSLLNPLTGLLNLRGYEKELPTKIAQQRRTNYEVDKIEDKGGLGFIFFDAVGFKKINDTLGHPVGDKGIKIIAEVLSGNTRRGDDLLVHKGGDEFIMVEPVASGPTLQEMVYHGSENTFLDRINEQILERMRLELGQEYKDKCDGMGIMRAQSFYLTPEDLTKSEEELAELIERKMIAISKKMEKNKRDS